MLAGYIFIKWRDLAEQLPEQLALFFLFATFGSTLGLTACWLASLKNLKFVELYGSALAGSCFVMMAICIHTDIVDVTAPQFGIKSFLALLYYCLDAGLLSSNFMPKILPRVFWLYSTMVLVFLEEVKEDKSIWPKIILLTATVALFEVMFFVHLREQVKLFLQTKVSKLQELQFMNMLESVPNNMLVCSNERDKDFKPKPLYNNRKMREFFGGCLVNPKK